MQTIMTHIVSATPSVMRRPRSSVPVGEDVLQEEPEPCGWFLFGEDLAHRGEDIIGGVQVEHLRELPDVFRVTGPGCQRFHGQEMLGRGGEDTKTRVVEYPGGRRVPARRDIGTGLLVQPPAGQAEFGCHRQCLLKNDAVRLEEGIDVTSGPARVVCEGHRGTPE